MYENNSHYVISYSGNYLLCTTCKIVINKKEHTLYVLTFMNFTNYNSYEKKDTITF